MSDRPISLIEILVAEYDLQAQMNGWDPLPCPFTNQEKHCRREGERTIREICDDLHAKAQSLKGSRAEREEFFCRETDRLLKEFYEHIHGQAEKHPRVAICFSGGGIRSATFGLGLLQGLARRGIGVEQFHYVSTVSGGGYIGSWLSAWIHRQGIECVQRGLRCAATEPPPSDATPPPCADENAEPARPAATPPSTPATTPSTAPAATSPAPCDDPKRSPLAPEPTTIQHLRRYSNYMSPRFGLLSADTWTLVGIFLRNLTLNWTVLIPVLVTALALPRLIVSFACWEAPVDSLIVQAVFILAFVAGAVGVAYMVANLPSWRRQNTLREKWKTEKNYLWFCWMMFNISAILIALYWAWIHIPVKRNSWLPFVLFGLMLSVVGYLIARLLYIRRSPPRQWKLDLMDFTVRAVAGAVGGALLYFAALAFQTPIETYKKSASVTPARQSAVAPSNFAPSNFAPSNFAPSNVTVNLPELPAKIEIAISPEAKPPAPPQPPDEVAMQRISQEAGLYVTLAPPIFLLMFLIAATIFIGLASTFTNDADREWMARSGGWMLIMVFGWAALSALVIFGPVGLVWAWQKFRMSLLSVGTLSGLLTLVGGFSSRTPAKGKDSASKSDVGPVARAVSTSLPMAATVFAVIILAALSLATSKLIALALPPGSLPINTQNIAWHLGVLYQSPVWLVAKVIGAIAAFGLFMSVFININKFSLHAAYRDRLIRAYLGASQGAKRRPNPFTGFDDLDNLQMHDLLTEIFQPDSFNQGLNALVEELQSKTPRGAFVRDRLSPETCQLLSDVPLQEDALKQSLANDFNRIIETEDLWLRPEFEDAKTKPIQDLIDRQPQIPLVSNKWPRPVFVEKLLINRSLVEQAFAGLIVAPVAGPRPLHVVNIALNLVGGSELAWQERKAQPFTVSALHAGSYGLGYRPANQYAISRQQNGALSLGTAMAISGAAVSPNMGYHSSPIVTFLLMLFNVRLGWWLGNPGEAGADTFMKSSPFFTPKPLIAETLGMTDSAHKYVYLSDGDHFENLALYEMVRRRCRFIIVSDAGADGDFNFGDLGNALRKIRIDLGVAIEFPQDMPIQPTAKTDALFALKGKDEDKRKYCALGHIKYSETDGKKARDGLLVFIKPTVYGIDEPPDVRTYAKANPTFPHETTGDQMYSESQFESYRALGEHVVAQMTNGKDDLDIESLMREVHLYLGRKAPNDLTPKRLFRC